MTLNRIPLWYECPAVTPPKGLLLSVGPWPSHTESREGILFSSLIRRFLCFQNGLPLPSAPYTTFVTHKCFSPNGVQRQYCPAKFQIQNDTLTHFSTNLVILSKQDICLCDTRCSYGITPHAGPRLFSNFSQPSAPWLNPEIFQESTTNLLTCTTDSLSHFWKLGCYLTNI